MTISKAQVRRPAAVLFAFAMLAGVTSAHVMVSPPTSKPGITQAYELRIHNEGKVATTSVELEIPDGIMVMNVATPDSGTLDTKKSGERISKLVWRVDVPPSKYVALKFSAMNPAGDEEVHWNVLQHLADGSVVDWSDRPGAKEKASVTKLAGAKSSDAAPAAHDDASHSHRP